MARSRGLYRCSILGLGICRSSGEWSSSTVCEVLELDLGSSPGACAETDSPKLGAVGKLLDAISLQVNKQQENNKFWYNNQTKKIRKLRYRDIRAVQHNTRCNSILSTSSTRHKTSVDVQNRSATRSTNQKENSGESDQRVVDRAYSIQIKNIQIKRIQIKRKKGLVIGLKGDVFQPISSRKRYKISPWLLWKANRKQHPSFWMAPVSIEHRDVEWCHCSC